MEPALPRHEWRADLHRGDTLLLYTDGLIERRGQDLITGLNRLRSALAAAVDRSADETCGRLLDELLDEGVSDDVAIIAVRVLG